MSWRSATAASEADMIASEADDAIERLVALAERGARAEADAVLLAAATGLREGRPLGRIAGALRDAAEQLEQLGHQIARARAACKGVAL